MDGSLPDSSVHGISQARILGWVVISFSRGSSWPSYWTLASCISCLAGKFFVFFVCFYHWATWEAFRMCTHTLICHILFIIDYKKLSCHGEQYLLSSIINSYWGDSSYKDKFCTIYPERNDHVPVGLWFGPTYVILWDSVFGLPI